MSIYLELTEQFNDGRVRAIISSGQAVVLHRLAVMSKDGDWILREDAESTGHVLSVLAGRGAEYRFGAPLDIRWLAGGWSSHLEFRHNGLRIRTDFVSRPPRISRDDLARLWQEQEQRRPPVVDPRRLADLKKTNRERDYAVIGELARVLEDPRDQLLYSRSARDLLAVGAKQADLARQLAKQRPLLGLLAEGREAVERALDAERRTLMHANEERLARYLEAARPWLARWPALEREIAGRPLLEAHDIVVRRAEGCLPFALPGDTVGGAR